MDIQTKTTLLNELINKFHITATNGTRFWAPYLINFNYSQDPTVPRGLGKSSSGEIKKSAEYAVSLFPNSNGEEIRKLLIGGSLPQKDMNYKGIDCSGFVYYVMSEFYQSVFNKELMDDLSVPKDHVLNGAYNLDDWKKEYALSEDEADKLPQDVSMRWVVETFKRKPVNLCRVAGLVSDYSSSIVTVNSMQIGDLVELSGREGYKEHVAVICGVDKESVKIAHSGRRDPTDVGGVVIENLKYDLSKIFSEKMLVPRDFIAVRRLKSLMQAAI